MPRKFFTINLASIFVLTVEDGFEPGSKIIHNIPPLVAGLASDISEMLYKISLPNCEQMGKETKI